MSDPAPSQDAAEIVRESRSNLAFALACLPKERRRDMYVFYAFCRVVDDLADDEGIPVPERRAGLERWREVVRGNVSDPAPLEREVISVQRRHGIPEEEMAGIIDGVSMDLEPRRYATWEELRGYCYLVAGCVGLVSVRIFGCHSPHCRDYAVNLGYALQITNILRDIAGDWENGQRVYLPQDEMAAAGYTDDDLANQRENEAFQRMMEKQIARARRYFDAAVAAHTAAGDRVPLLASETMRRIYCETLDLLENDGCRVFEQRYTLPKWRKMWLVAGAWLRGLSFRLVRGMFTEKTS